MLTHIDCDLKVIKPQDIDDLKGLLALVINRW